MELQYLKIGDLCNVSSSKRVFARQYVDGGIPFYRQKEIIDKKNGNPLEEPIYISESVYNEFKDKSGVPESGDLLITAVGATLGIPYVVGNEKFYFKDGNLIWLNDFKEELNSKFLYYWIDSTFGTQTLWNRTIGSAQPALTIDSIKKLPIPIPSRKIQDKIASTLKTYDKMLENNNKRIRLLEQMAENLYKEWFIRFRFPGYEHVEFVGSSLGKIPYTFNIVKIGTVIEYYIGGGWGEEELSELFPEEAYVVRGTDFPNVKHGIIDSCPLRYHKSSNYNKRSFKANDIAFEVSGGTQKQPVGRSILITERQLNRFNNRLICASFCKLIRCNIKKISPRYFYHWLQYLYETRIIEQYQLQSTGIINFKFEYFLRKCNLMIPPKDIMEKFTELVKPIYDEIDNLAEQNTKLNVQRDMLLPRLMSGKLEV